MEAHAVVGLLESLGSEQCRIVGDKVTCTCIVHHERRPSACVWYESATYSCLACGASGVLAKVVMDARGCTWKEAVSYIRRFGEYEWESSGNKPVLPYGVREDNSLPELPRAVLMSLDEPNWKMRHYLKKRGVSKEVMRKANLRRLKDEGRIVFVWYDELTPMGMTVRSYREDDDPQRGMPLLGFEKHQMVYTGGSYEERFKEIVICEGEISCLRLWSMGVPSVALSGWKMGEEQAQKIISMADKAILMFDNDDGGYNGVARASLMLGDKMPVFTPFGDDLPVEYKDPADCPEDVLREMLEGEMRLC